MTAYKLEHKIRTPKTIPSQPEKLTLITYALRGATFLSVGLFLLSVISINLPGVAFSIVLGLGTYIAYRYRSYHHSNDLKIYRETVENLWISSKGFTKMRDYFMLLGFTSQTAYAIAEELGTDVLTEQTYSQAQGYYPLTNVEGAKVMSAILVESDLTRKGNLKLTTTILPST